jgi:outer membrane protein assembly factor BamE (lipoprotein component of BamABCDE complex)
MIALPGKKPRRLRGRLLPILLILILPLFLGAWRDASGNTINPRYVERIQNGKTTKQEILLFFGDPKDIEKSDEGAIYKYTSYKDAPADEMPYKHDKRQIQEHSDSLYVIDDDKQIRKPQVKKEGKIPRSTLTVRFSKDGQTVMSHEYKEF